MLLLNVDRSVDVYNGHHASGKYCIRNVSLVIRRSYFIYIYFFLFLYIYIFVCIFIFLHILDVILLTQDDTTFYISNII